MGLFGPLCAEETPRYTEQDHENVDHCHDLGAVLDDVVGTRLDDGGVEGEQVESGDEVAVQEGQKCQ